jgi:hypothetical protein
MQFRFNSLLASPVTRLGFPILLLTVAALVFGVLAWREAERAGATADVLMKDYASFIAQKFVQGSAARYSSWVGIHEWNRNPEALSPLAILRAHGEARERGRVTRLPTPEIQAIQYFFLYESVNRGLEIAGVYPSDGALLFLSVFASWRFRQTV